MYIYFDFKCIHKTKFQMNVTDSIIAVIIITITVIIMIDIATFLLPQQSWNRNLILQQSCCI